MSERRVPSRVPVPRGMAERARDFFARGLVPAEPRDAATVILLRQSPAVEVFLLRRAGVLEFAPGACVFPGGSVDGPDADPGIGETGWAGPSPADLGGLLGVPPDRARALVCAAVRETFEESGVLLAGPSPAELVRDGAALEQDRDLLLSGAASIGDLLRLRGLLLRADLLTPWARWITPVISPRRFDTWFFATTLPPGQTTSLAAGESDAGSWWEPSAAVQAARDGEITLLPPTAVTLAELAGYQDVAAVMAARRQIVPLLPAAIVEDDQVWLAVPPEVEYPL